MREGAWVKLRLEMLISPAWAVLGTAAKRIVERLMIEHMKQAGKKNGRLICTYGDFEKYGIRRQSIRQALKQTTNLGFVAITRCGHRSPDHSWPSQYRLTFLATADAEPTDDWKRTAAPRKPRKIQKPSVKNAPSTGVENAPSTGVKNATPVPAQSWVQKRNSFLESTHLRHQLRGAVPTKPVAPENGSEAAVATVIPIKK